MKHKELAKMSKSEREKKLKELEFELIKSRTGAAKTGSSKSRQIRKMIARIFTLNSKEELKQK